MSTNAAHTTNEERPRKRKGVTILKDARIDAISLVDRGANNHRFFLFKRATDFVDIDGNLIHVEQSEENVDKILPLFKGDTDESGNWRTAYCVVAVPGEVDQQEDVWPQEEVRKSAHEFLKNGALINYMHKDLSKIGDTVESYIAPVDMQIGDEKIIAGSWIIGIEPFDQVKQEIEKGYITGVSVQGTSRRVAMEKNTATLTASPNAMAATVPPAAPVENQSNGENAKNQRRIPIGAEGPGIKKLQHLLGVPETGIYDQVTELAFVEFLMRQGVEPEPTVQAMQDVLKQIEDSAAGAAALDTSTPSVAPKTAVEAAPNVVAPVAKDFVSMQEVATRRKDHGYGTMDVTGPVPGTITHVAVSNNPTTGVPQDSSVNVVDLKAIVSGDSNDPEDLKVALYLAAKRGNDHLMNHLNTVHGIKEPEEIFTTPFELDHLKLMVKVFILGEGDLREEENQTGTEGAGVSSQVHKSGELSKLATGNVAVWDNGKSAGVVLEDKGDTVVVEVEDKSGKITNVTKKKTDVTIIGSGSEPKKADDEEEVEKCDCEDKKKCKHALNKTASRPGSMHGHDPKKNGKIKHIVRSFGKWAGGKHRVCTARIRTEHPELAASGDVNALCAWLKDQWKGTTHWRGDDNKLAKAMESYDLTDEQVDDMFNIMCADMGIDAEVSLEKMVSDDYDAYLDELFGEEEVSKASDYVTTDDLTDEDRSILDRIVGIFKSNKKTEEKAEESRQLFDTETVNKADEATDSNATDHLDAAMRGLMVGMADALKNEDKDIQLSDLDHVLSDFSKWAEDYNDEIIEKSVKENMEKAVDPIVAADNPAKPDVPKKAGSLIGKTVTVGGKTGKVLTQFGTTLSIKLEDGSTVKAEVKDVKVVNANPTNGGKMEDVAKAAIDLDEERKARIVETRAFLDELLGESDTSAEATTTEVEKTEEATEQVAEATEEVVNEAPEAETEVVDTAAADEAPETTLNDVILFVNRLADQVETVSKSIEDQSTLTEKVEELAKRADVSEVLAEIKSELDELKKSFVPASQVEEVAKRLQAVENTPGTRTSEPVNEVRETVNKSATSSAWTGRF